MTQSTNLANSGVSREEAESILKRFLNNENYRVLAVKGTLGIGKTYLVQNFLSKYKKEYYFYGSVFGISSIEQLKARIIANYKKNPKDNIQEYQTKPDRVNWYNQLNKLINIFFEWINRNSPRLEKTPKLDLVLSGKSSIPVVGSLIYVAGDLALNILFNLNVKKSIVCIDDLERKSNISLDEVLGFVEYLVQELDCKIIIIFDDSNFDENSIKILNKYREKVIDREFKLNPTVEENLDFIFKDNSDIEVIKEVFLRAGTKNIRVIRKTKWLIDELIPLMENWQPSLRNQVIINSIIINLAKIDTEFSKKFSIGIDTILSLIDSSIYVAHDNDNSNKRIQAISLLSYLGFNFIKLDQQIIQLVETSLFISDNFIQEGNILNKEEEKKHILDKIRTIEKLYYSSFADNEREIVKELIYFFENYCLDLTFSQFEQMEQFASVLEVDVSSYEKSLLEHKLKTLEPHYFNDLNSLMFKVRKYPELEAYLEDKKNEYLQALDITTAITNLIKSDSGSISPWLEANIYFLNRCTVDEYCQWLQKGHPDLYLLVKNLLKQGLPASQNLNQAIYILGKNNKLNKIRAKFLYNIDIDNPSNTN